MHLPNSIFFFRYFFLTWGTTKSPPKRTKSTGGSLEGRNNFVEDNFALVLHLGPLIQNVLLVLEQETRINNTYKTTSLSPSYWIIWIDREKCDVVRSGQVRSVRPSYGVTTGPITTGLQDTLFIKFEFSVFKTLLLVIELQ